MLIPAQRPDAVEAPTLRREALPTSPALPVSGLAEQAQNADPRLAVQAVQPGFQGQAATGLRPAPGLAAAPEQAAVLAGAADPSALLELSAPGSAITQWLSLVLTRRPLGQGLPWPQPDAQAQGQADAAAPPGPLRKLWAVYLALARSDVFATTHLFRHFWPETRPRPGEQGVPEEQVRRWLQALAPESESALEGGSMLLGGVMSWQGELMPGWPMSLRREDAWRPDEAGRALQKGVALQVDLLVPNRGPLRIHAFQWDERELDIRLSWPDGADWPLATWEDLRARLASMNLPGLKLGRLAWSLGEGSSAGAPA
jgi:hypothetical protein